MLSKKSSALIQAICLAMLVFISSTVIAKPALWTNHAARLQSVSTTPGSNINWVLLPGGPGDSSKYLQGFAKSLQLPGSTWLLDLPENGSNELDGRKVDFNQWPNDLVEAVSSLPNVVLISHSFGGMLTLSSPKLKDHLKAMVLISTSPDNSFLEASEQLTKALKLPDLEAVKKHYFEQHHDDEGLRYVNVAIAKDYYFTPAAVKQGTQLVKNMSYNHVAFDWGLNDFVPHYNAKWIPKNMPVLILAGEKDRIVPPDAFPNNAKFHRPNIQMVMIPNAGHYPWVDNEKATVTAIRKFATQIVTGQVPTLTRYK